MPIKCNVRIIRLTISISCLIISIIRLTISIIRLTISISRLTISISHFTISISRLTISTRKNCFRYLKLMSPLNAAICTTTYLERKKCDGSDKKMIFKKQLFDLQVKYQGPTKVITVRRDTPPYGHASTYQISLTYLKRQKCYGPHKKILFRNNYLTLRSKVKVLRGSLRYATHYLMVMHSHTK